MVYHIISGAIKYSIQMCLCDGHADCHTHTCTQWASSRLDTDGMAVFRMTRRKRIQLTEVFQVIFGQPIPEQMKQCIK